MTDDEEPAPRNRSIRKRSIAVGIAILVGAGALFWLESSTPDISRARRLLEIQEVSQARTEIDRILSEAPDDSTALLLKARLFRMEGNLSGAIDCCRKVSSGSTDFRESSLLQIQMLLESLNLEAAELQMQRHLQWFPDERIIWDELRWLCFNQFRTRDVDELSRWWLKTHPDDTDALTHLLLGVFRPQVPQEGTPYLHRIQKSASQQISVLRGLAWAAWQSGRRDEATRLLGEAWAVDPADPRTRLMSAGILIEDRDFIAAERVLGAEPFGVNGELFGNQADRWHWLQSRVMLSRNDIAAAFDHVTQAAKSREWELEYVHSRAVLLKQLGRDQESHIAFRKAREIERCRKRFAEIAFSGAWKNLTSELREELADLYERCHDSQIAALWRR